MQQMEFNILEGEKKKLNQQFDIEQRRTALSKQQMLSRDARMQNIIDEEVTKTLPDRIDQIQQAMMPVIQNEIDQKNAEITAINSDIGLHQRMVQEAMIQVATVKSQLGENPETEYAELKKIMKEMCCYQKSTTTPYTQLVRHDEVHKTIEYVKKNFSNQGMYDSKLRRQAEDAAEEMKSNDDGNVVKLVIATGTNYDKDKTWTTRGLNEEGETRATYHYWWLYYNAKHINGKALLYIKSGEINADVSAKHALSGKKLENALILHVAELEVLANQQQATACEALKDVKYEELEAVNKKRLCPRVQNI